MATRIRLQRQGKKNQPFYHIVVADGRAPRNGSYIERLGTYNPLTNPAEVKINFERALYWVEVGACPSDTARALLRHEGVYLMKHLRGGIAKGALTENDAQRKFDAWKQERESKLNNIKREAADAQRKVIKTRLEAETKVKEAIAAKVAAKLQAAAEAQAAKEAEAAEQAAAEAAAAEQAEGEEAPAAEATETPAE
ncbi:MAG: 30S ribosomal protein S16 [Bacteroidales bacterium]|nr:30S ribosomal protein S16 [Bacteroidales bacterium]